MAADNLTFLISGHPDFWAKTSLEVIAADTTLLDTFEPNASGEIILEDWEPRILDFWMRLLHEDDDEVEELFDEFEAEVKDVWYIASFHEMFIQHADMDDDRSETQEPGRPTLRMRQWFRRWWDENNAGFRVEAAMKLNYLVMPAFYIGDAQTFMSVTHDWFLHINGKQALEGSTTPDDYDRRGKDAIKTYHPLLGKLAAARSNMVGKIEGALPYDEKRDGLPRGRGRKSTVCEDPDWCPKLKSAAYYKELHATGCWPVRIALKDDSIYGVLTCLAGSFDYVNYDDVRDMPDRDLAHARMPTKHSGKSDAKGGVVNEIDGAFKQLDVSSSTHEDKEGMQSTQASQSKEDNSNAADVKKHKRCRVCVNAAVKASFDKKVNSLIRTLLDDKKTSIVIERQGALVKAQVNDSFAGLCLDCLTKTKLGSEDADYWNHCLDFEFDHGCTVAHAQPTWYFSFMGRPEDMKRYAKEARLRTRRRADH
ncbi:hypothetical protein Daus18300_004522 [Diaporthe australafricana]|uniref:Uncharacterized protein n=1 Tax=Diaporthe australafricana TaxID=127596 RepID=A0ABR3X817_9PEZI